MVGGSSYLGREELLVYLGGGQRKTDNKLNRERKEERKKNGRRRKRRGGRREREENERKKSKKVKEQNGEREKFNQTNKTNKQNKLNQNYYTISYLRLLCFVEFAILISHLPSQFNSNQKKTSSIFFYLLFIISFSFFLSFVKITIQLIHSY